MKKLICLVLACLMAFSLCACGGDSADSSTAASSTAAVSSATQNTDNVSSNVVSEPIIPEVNDYSKRTYKAVDILDYLKIDGRYTVTKTDASLGLEDCITYDNTAQLLAFNADCEGDVVINTTLKVGNTEERASHYYLVVVDGVEQRVAAKGIIGSEFKSTITVATGLAKGKHEFKIYRQTELLHGVENIVSITMNGVPTEKPADKDLYIEFLGDSITAGYGDLTTGDDKDDPSGPLKSSGTDTYAFLAAKQLGADVSIVARSGLAFSFDNDPIEPYWKSITFARQKLGEYKFERKPDVVVINLGTNDEGKWRKGEIEITKIKEDAVKLLNMVRASHADAKIVWIYGTMDSGLADTIKSAVGEVGGEDKGFYFLLGKTNYQGGGGHPNADAHKENGKLLADFISNILK